MAGARVAVRVGARVGVRAMALVNLTSSYSILNMCQQRTV